MLEWELRKRKLHNETNNILMPENKHYCNLWNFQSNFSFLSNNQKKTNFSFSSFSPLTIKIINIIKKKV